MPFKDQTLTFNKQARDHFGSEIAWRADLERYQRGDRVEMGDYEIMPKRDVIGWPHTHGWVVVKSGCNALPAATWAHSLVEAQRLVHCFVAAGEDASGAAKRFWALVRLTERPVHQIDTPAPAENITDKDAVFVALVSTLRATRDASDFRLGADLLNKIDDVLGRAARF